MKLKTYFMWSATLMCGILGTLVWYNGGWRNVLPILRPVKFTKTIWVTNYVSRSEPEPWLEPLKPLNTSIIEAIEVWTNNLIISTNPYYAYPMNTNTEYITNMLFYNNTIIYSK